MGLQQHKKHIVSEIINDENATVVDEEVDEDGGGGGDTSSASQPRTDRGGRRGHALWSSLSTAAGAAAAPAKEAGAETAHEEYSTLDLEHFLNTVGFAAE